jgi:hypothetical protein
MPDFHPSEADDVVFAYHSNPPIECDLCTAAIDDIFYDAKVMGLRGKWANMCVGCFTEHRCRLGTGFGQQYERQEDGRYKKIRG